MSGSDAAQAAELLFEHDSVEADVFDAAYLRPFDEAALLASAEKTGRVLTVEEHSVVGGLGAIVASGNLIGFNAPGVQVDGTAGVYSFGDNYLNGNTPDGTFTAPTQAPQ